MAVSNRIHQSFLSVAFVDTILFSVCTLRSLSELVVISFYVLRDVYFSRTLYYTLVLLAIFTMPKVDNINSGFCLSFLYVAGGNFLITN